MVCARLGLVVCARRSGPFRRAAFRREALLPADGATRPAACHALAGQRLEGAVGALDALPPARMGPVVRKVGAPVAEQEPRAEGAQPCRLSPDRGRLATAGPSSDFRGLFGEGAVGGGTAAGAQR